MQAQFNPSLPGLSPPPGLEAHRLLDWPVVADLDNDGKFEVIIPAGDVFPSSKWSGVEVLNGADGKVRWLRRLNEAGPNESVSQCDRFLVGSDLNHDGCRDLFVASTSSLPMRKNYLHVDALSGKDGHTLWWWSKPLSNNIPWIGSLRWWLPGPDGWPRLLVPTTSLDPQRPGGIHVLSAGTGKLEHFMPQAFDPEVADLDGDGIPDLICLQYTGQPFYRTGELYGVRGVPATVWRRFGVWQPAQDLDGDDVTDLLNLQNGKMTAISGRQGPILWQAAVGDGTPIAPSLPEGDLDGDGTPDILVMENGNDSRSSSDQDRVAVPLQAFSGKTGKRLWQTENFRLNPSGQRRVPVAHLVRCQDLDGDGRPEVIVLSILLAQSNGRQVWLTVWSGDRGELLWHQLLHETSSSNFVNFSSFLPQPAFMDLDGDGIQDIVVTVPIFGDGKIVFEVKAFNGRDGTLLWQWPLSFQSKGGFSPGPVPVVVDFQNNAKPTVLISDIEPADPGQKVSEQLKLSALDGKTGKALWTWKAPLNPGFSPRPPMPRLLKQKGDNRQSVAIRFMDPGPDGDQLVVLDHQGQEKWRKQNLAQMGLSFQSELWNHHLKSDDETDWVFSNHGKVQAFRGKLDQLLWETSLPESFGEIQEIQPGLSGRGPQIIVKGIPLIAYGLDGATGKPIWKGVGLPGDSHGSVNRKPMFGSAFLRTDHPQGLPLIAGRLHDTTVCRSTMPLQPGTEPPMRVPAVVEPAPDDPRLLRGLPWVEKPADYLEDLRQGSLGGAGLLLWALLILVAGRRRSWRLGFLAIVAGVSVITLTPLLLNDLPALDPRPHAVLLPGLLFLVVLSRWVWCGHWKKAAMLLSVCIIGSLLIAEIWLGFDRDHLRPDQHYSWQGWYWAGIWGASTAGFLLLLAFLLRPVFLWCRGLVTWWFRRAKPA